MCFTCVQGYNQEGCELRWGGRRDLHWQWLHWSSAEAATLPQSSGAPSATSTLPRILVCATATIDAIFYSFSFLALLCVVPDSPSLFLLLSLLPYPSPLGCVYKSIRAPCQPAAMEGGWGGCGMGGWGLLGKNRHRRPGTETQGNGHNCLWAVKNSPYEVWLSVNFS